MIYANNLGNNSIVSVLVTSTDDIRFFLSCEDVETLFHTHELHKINEWFKLRVLFKLPNLINDEKLIDEKLV